MDDSDDRNADLIGYEYEIAGDPPSRWRVVGTDAVLGAGYVDTQRVDGEGMRVQTSSSIRRRKHIEETLS